MPASDSGGKETPKESSRSSEVRTDSEDMKMNRSGKKRKKRQNQRGKKKRREKIQPETDELLHINRAKTRMKSLI